MRRAVSRRWRTLALVGDRLVLFLALARRQDGDAGHRRLAIGRAGKNPAGQRWAASIGLLTFAIGVLTRQWRVAIAGIVYSQLTAAALWQNFRWRLPYLYDSWSETLPPAPTLMHAMIAISAMVEGASILSASAIPFVGRDNLMVVTPIAYGLCAIVACFFVARFLRRRGVPQREDLDLAARRRRARLARRPRNSSR